MVLTQEPFTVMIEPQMKVAKGLIAPSTLGISPISSAPKRRFHTPGPSPANKTIGASTPALRRLVYHESRRALPSTTVRLCLITTECMAVIAELATPNPIPTSDNGVPSRNTPTKNPSVTTEHEIRIRRDGRECRTMKEVQTVKGKTRPRATW